MEEATHPSLFYPPPRPPSALSLRSDESEFTNASTAESDNSDLNADIPPPRRTRARVYKREGYKCRLCGSREMPGKILRIAEWRTNVRAIDGYLWRQALVPEDWDRDNPSNLMYLCDDHLIPWVSGAVTFAPTPADRVKMMQHEQADVQRRLRETPPGGKRPLRTFAENLSGDFMLIVCRPEDVNFANAQPGSPLHTWRYTAARPVIFSVALNPYAVLKRSLECICDAYVPCEEDVVIAEKELVLLRDTFSATPCYRPSPPRTPFEY